MFLFSFAIDEDNRVRNLGKRDLEQSVHLLLHLLLEVLREAEYDRFTASDEAAFQLEIQAPSWHVWGAVPWSACKHVRGGVERVHDACHECVCCWTVRFGDVRVHWGSSPQALVHHVDVFHMWMRSMCCTCG